MARKYDAYLSLQMALKRDNFKLPGTLAGILLECFAGRKQKFSAKILFEKGVCERGAFKEFRKKLGYKGYVVYEFKQVGDRFSSDYKEGHKLKKYINKHLVSSSVLATRDDIAIVDNRVSQLEERVKLLEKCILKDIEENDPPATKEKLENKLKLIGQKNG